jgi:hypothetical protein
MWKRQEIQTLLWYKLKRVLGKVTHGPFAVGHLRFNHLQVRP